MSVAAERAVLFIVLLHADRFAGAARRLVVDDFASAAHRGLWTALAGLHATCLPDLPAVHDAIAGRVELADALVAVMAADTPAPGLLDRHIDRVLEHAATRRLTDVIAQTSADLADGGSIGDVVDQLRHGLDRVTLPAGQLPAGYLTPSELIALAAIPAEPWTVPNVVRRRSRAVVVAREGAGKTVALRQMVVAPAAGLHPFTRQAIPAVRGLIVDLENDHGGSIHVADGTVDPTSVVGMIAAALAVRPDWQPDDWLRLWTRPRGVDLRDRADRQALDAVLADQRPELVAIGPVYRMTRRRGRETDEDWTLDVLAVLDELRDRYGFALVVEAHAPHAPPGAKRELRPLGSSAWLRWPDLGRTLAPHNGALKVDTFRGDRYRVAWPTELHRAGHGELWPWTGRYADGIPPIPTPRGAP